MFATRGFPEVINVGDWVLYRNTVPEALEDSIRVGAPFSWLCGVVIRGGWVATANSGGELRQLSLNVEKFRKFPEEYRDLFPQELVEYAKTVTYDLP